MNLLLVLISLSSIISCSTARIDLNLAEEIENCYDPVFREHLNKIVSEMDKHIIRNGWRTFPNYLESLHKENFKIEDYYSKTEVALGKQLYNSTFEELFCDFTYLKDGVVVSEDDYLADTYTIAVKADLSHEKNFLKCMHLVKDKNSFVNEFLNLDMYATTPKEFTRWIYNYQNKPGYNQKIAKQIIALEMYLIVLNTIGHLGVPDCP